MNCSYMYNELQVSGITWKRLQVCGGAWNACLNELEECVRSFKRKKTRVVYPWRLCRRIFQWHGGSLYFPRRSRYFCALQDDAELELKSGKISEITTSGQHRLIYAAGGKEKRKMSNISPAAKNTRFHDFSRVRRRKNMGARRGWFLGRQKPTSSVHARDELPRWWGWFAENARKRGASWKKWKRRGKARNVSRPGYFYRKDIHISHRIVAIFARFWRWPDLNCAKVNDDDDESGGRGTESTPVLDTGGWRWEAAVEEEWADGNCCFISDSANLARPPPCLLPNYERERIRCARGS